MCRWCWDIRGPTSSRALTYMLSIRLCCTQLLAMKRSPDDILKLFNSQPHNALFAGSPAQVRHKTPRYLPDCADCVEAAGSPQCAANSC